MFTPTPLPELPVQDGTALPPLEYPEISRTNAGEIQALAVFGETQPWGSIAVGKTVYSATNRGVLVWDGESGEVLRVFDLYPHHWSNVVLLQDSFQVTPDGRFLLVVTAQSVEVWTADGKQVFVERLGNVNAAASISGDGRTAAISLCEAGFFSSSSCQLKVVDTASKAVLLEVEGGEKPHLSPNGRWLSFAANNQVYIYSTADWKEQTHFLLFDAFGERHVFSPDGSLFAQITSQTIYFWQIGERRLVRQMNLTSNAAPAAPVVTISPDNQFVLIEQLFSENGAEIRSLVTGEIIANEPDVPNRAVGIGADGQMVSYPGPWDYDPDSFAIISELAFDRTGRLHMVKTIFGHIKSQGSQICEWTIDQPELSCSFFENGLVYWDRVGEQHYSYSFAEPHPGSVYQGLEQPADYWTLPNGMMLAGYENPIVGGRWAVLRPSRDGSTTVYALPEMKKIMSSGGHCDKVLISPNKRLFAYGGAEVQVIDEETGNTLLKQKADYSHAYFLLDDALIEAGIDHQNANLLFVDIYPLNGEKSRLVQIPLDGFLPLSVQSSLPSIEDINVRGDLAALISGGGEIYLVSLSDGELLYRWQAHAEGRSSNQIVFSPDGRFLVTTAEDGFLKVWGIMPGEK